MVRAMRAAGVRWWFALGRRSRAWSPARAPCLGLACVLLGACAGVAVRVSDAATGAPVAGARLSPDPDAPVAAVTGHDGRARLPPAPPGSMLWIRADGYQPWYGQRQDARSPDGGLAVALSPAWLDAFMDGRAHPRGQIDPDGTPPPCHCLHEAR
jgi:hypothetical protein